MTTTELIKILKDREFGSVTHKSRKISLTVNGKYMPEPNIILSGTGDGIVGAEIDFDIEGEMWDENGDVIKRCIGIADITTNGDVIKALFPNMNIKERNNITLEIRGEILEFTGMALKEWWDAPYGR